MEAMEAQKAFKTARFLVRQGLISCLKGSPLDILAKELIKP